MLNYSIWPEQRENFPDLERQTEPQSRKGLEKPFFSRWKKWGREIKRDIQVYEIPPSPVGSVAVDYVFQDTTRSAGFYSATPLCLSFPNCVLFLSQTEVAYSAIFISFLPPITLCSPTNQNTSHSSSPEVTFNLSLWICFPFACDALPSLGSLSLAQHLRPNYRCTWLSLAELAIVS